MEIYIHIINDISFIEISICTLYYIIVTEISLSIFNMLMYLI